MEKSVFTPHYGSLRARLVEMRKAAGLNQRDLATRLGRERSFVSRIELGERRVDLVEFYWICRACGQDPAKLLESLTADFDKIESRTKRSRKM